MPACPHCQTDNAPGAKFCQECAAPLAARCASCGSQLPPAAKFCPECAHPAGGPAATPARFASPEAYTPRHLAEKILTSGSALAGERKQVTVLFVDVSGFTSLSERLDPEEVHQLMSRAFELMLAEVHRYEGTVNQFLGDGIMALFGAPIAHEDHARRAVHAALGIARALEGYQRELAPRGITFRARQGLNTGLVVVGSHRQRPAHGLHGGGRHHQRGRAHAAGRRARTGDHRGGDAPARPRLLRDALPGRAWP